MCVCHGREWKKLTIYDEMDNVLYEGQMKQDIISTVARRNKDKLLTFEYSYNY